MGLSLRDLMKREKESRKRKSNEDEEENKTKLQKISQTDENNLLKEDVTKVKESLSSDSGEKVESLTKVESQNDNVHEQTLKSTGVRFKDENKDLDDEFSVPHPLNKLKENLTFKETEDEQKEELKRTLSENLSDLEVLEETYELLEDDEFPASVSSLTDKDLKSKTKHGSSLLNEYGDYNELSTELDLEKGKSDENYSVVDENRLVYEQLNTAYCSNLDYEHENILREAGVKHNLGDLGSLKHFGKLGNSLQNKSGLSSQLITSDQLGHLGVYDNLDEYQLDLEDEYDLENTENNENKNVITSSNFGVSTLSVSSTDNLPVGFFDDQNVDAKARGKLTAKKAQNKIKELTKKRSSYLKEAKYIQQKYIEEYREKNKMENDLLDNKETYKELKDKLIKIKEDLNVDKNNLKLDNENRDNKIEEIMKQYSDLDYDDLSWMSRSII